MQKRRRRQSTPATFLTGTSFVLALTFAALSPSGCGRRGDLLGTWGTGGTGGPTADGSAGPAPRFSPPQLVVSLSDPMARDADPSFTADLLELFFMSDRNGTPDIWTSRRASANDPWGPPVFVPGLSSFSADSGPSISLDGLRIWFSTERDFSFGRIWRSSRASRSAPWSPPQEVSELATPAKDFGPTVDAIETTMLFGSNRIGSAGFDVHVSTRVGPNGPWATVRQVPGINGPFDDWDPFVAQGGLVVFFTSTRLGAGDIFWSMRQSTTEPFSAPTPLADINSAAYDSDSSLSPDLTYLMFDSTRTGNSEIYEAHALR